MDLERQWIFLYPLRHGASIRLDFSSVVLVEWEDNPGHQHYYIFVLRSGHTTKGYVDETTHARIQHHIHMKGLAE